MASAWGFILIWTCRFHSKAEITRLCFSSMRTCFAHMARFHRFLIQRHSPMEPQACPHRMGRRNTFLSSRSRKTWTWCWASQGLPATWWLPCPKGLLPQLPIQACGSTMLRTPYCSGGPSRIYNLQRLPPLPPSSHSGGSAISEPAAAVGARAQNVWQPAAACGGLW